MLRLGEMKKNLESIHQNVLSSPGTFPNIFLTTDFLWSKVGRFKNGIVASGGFESAGGRGVLNQEILTNASSLSLIEYKGEIPQSVGPLKKI